MKIKMQIKIKTVLDRQAITILIGLVYFRLFTNIK